MDTSAQYVLLYAFEAGALFVSLMSSVVSARMYMYVYVYNDNECGSIVVCMEVKRAAAVFPNKSHSALGRATQSGERGSSNGISSSSWRQHSSSSIGRGSGTSGR